MEIQQGSTVAQVAAASPVAPSVLERYGIDYCCGGTRSFDDACREKGLSASAIGEELDRAAGAAAPATDWTKAPLGELIEHIVRTHHEYLKLELPSLGQRVAKVAKVHGDKDPAMLGELQFVYDGLRQELEMHLRKEEMVLFPAIVRYESAVNVGAPPPPSPFGTVANPIAMMESEHESAGEALRRIRELTNDYRPPAYACGTFRAMLNGLQQLEADLHIHIHLENNILFPRAIAMEG